MTSRPALPRTPIRRRPVKTAVTQPTPSSPPNRGKLWLAVAGATLLIAVVWLAAVGTNLGQTAQGDDSLYQRIKQEIFKVFGQGGNKQPDQAPLSNQQVDELERQVFPNINVSDSGVFQTAP